MPKTDIQTIPLSQLKAAFFRWTAQDNAFEALHFINEEECQKVREGAWADFQYELLRNDVERSQLDLLEGLPFEQSREALIRQFAGTDTWWFQASLPRQEQRHVAEGVWVGFLESLENVLDGKPDPWTREDEAERVKWEEHRRSGR